MLTDALAAMLRMATTTRGRRRKALENAKKNLLAPSVGAK
jgi:hypothetical protein